MLLKIIIFLFIIININCQNYQSAEKDDEQNNNYYLKHGSSSNVNLNHQQKYQTQNLYQNKPFDSLNGKYNVKIFIKLN